MPDDEKAKLYATSVRNYRYFQAPQSQYDSLQSTLAQRQAEDDSLLETIPGELMPKARHLLKLIKPHVRLSDEGEFATSEGGVIPLSNIGDLIESALNKKKSTKGLHEFIELLKRTGVPEEFIRKVPPAKKSTAPPLFNIGRHTPRPRVTSDTALAYAAAASPKRSKRTSKKPKQWVEFD